VLRVLRLAETALTRFERVDHPADADHIDPEEEVSQQYSVNVLERGSFSISDRSRVSRVTPAELFLTAPGKVHRYIHDELEGAPTDVCIAVCFTDQSRDDVQALLRPVQECRSVVAASNRRAYLRNRLLAHVAAGDDLLALDAIAAELLAAAAETGEGGHLYRPSQLAWYGRRVNLARCRLDEEFASDHTLTQLARDAGMSAFHFARVFRELTGVPPHRYLLQRRLAAAAQQLRAGAPVTDTCFAVGFRSLSHFIHAFRRHFGVSPSRMRATHRPSSSENR
jgi:AraC family transcriptional regulator